MRVPEQQESLGGQVLIELDRLHGSLATGIDQRERVAGR